MAYIGNPPTVGQWRKLDDISGSFNGSTTTFTTSVGGSNVTAGSANQLFVSLGGVIQQPNVDYSVTTNSIIFTTAPTSGLDFFAVLAGDALNTAVPADGSITTAKLAGNLTVDLDSGSAAAPSLTFDSDTGLYSPGADQLALSTNGVQRINIEADGDINIDSGGVFYDATNNRLAIGATAPEEALQVKGNISVGDGSASLIDLRFHSTGGNGTVRLRGQGETLQVYTGNAERARIDSSGRLLVGTSSTSTNTQVVVQGSSSASSGPGILYLARGNNSPLDGYGIGELYFTDSGHATSTRSAASITCARDGGTWTSGASMPGRLVFSTTADGASSPTERMRIANTGLIRAFSSEGVFRVNSSQGAGTTYELFWGGYGGSSTTTEGTNSIRIYTNGNIQNTNNSYGALSDIKLKENIVDANSQWDDIKALQVRNYNFKEGQTHTQIGLVAQEVELVSPGLVSETSDRDEDGNDLGTVTKSVNYSVLYMKAVKALQEAMERIETLEAKVAALESA